MYVCMWEVGRGDRASTLTLLCHSFDPYILVMLQFGFQDLTSGSENDRNDSASQPSNQSDTGKQGLGPLGTANPGHAAVKVRWARLHAPP